MDTLNNCRLGDKIYMFSKVDQNSDGHAMVLEQKEQIKAHESMTKSQKYYKDLAECHQVIAESYKKRNKSLQKKIARQA